MWKRVQYAALFKSPSRAIFDQQHSEFSTGPPPPFRTQQNTQFSQGPPHSFPAQEEGQIERQIVVLRKRIRLAIKTMVAISDEGADVGMNTVFT
ncbi:unnamed protein product [Adineta steineri]|uniref:Uncharacterized protein n=1 Tax=Adineta steineri TaxID=433720 RepID=A0A813XBB9_9BILA|nr:unnamed protein product [Adineta steineri]CAF0757412.1 unnamed protein product [Adineta steineri]CAF0865776.1 unnamed protein product [Adineta steineri]